MPVEAAARRKLEAQGRAGRVAPGRFLSESAREVGKERC